MNALDAIRSYIRRTGTPPKQLARECGIAYSTLMYILRGKYDRPATARVHAYVLREIARNGKEDK